MSSKILVECPHCKNKEELSAIGSINIEKQPHMRSKIQDLSCFRFVCSNCNVSSLVLQPCLYHDMQNNFMVWLCENKPESANFNPLSDYILRYVNDFNSFREKINILERGIDDRAVEMMKYLLFAQLNVDLDVVELLFHDFDEKTANFRFVAVLSDGVEQYISMSWQTYKKLCEDIEQKLFTSSKDFIKIDVEWAKTSFELLHSAV